jgi:hypothetical protein
MRLAMLWLVARLRRMLEPWFFKRRSPKGWQELEDET